MALVRKAALSPALDTSSGRGLVDIVARYAQTFLRLQRYDEGLLTESPVQPGGRLPCVKEARRTGQPESGSDGAGRGHRSPCPRPGRRSGIANG